MNESRITIREVTEGVDISVIMFSEKNIGEGNLLQSH